MLGCATQAEHLHSVLEMHLQGHMRKVAIWDTSEGCVWGAKPVLHAWNKRGGA